MGDMGANFINQTGFILQKLAHREFESNQGRNTAEVKDQQMDDSSVHETREVDVDHATKTYLSWRFIVGLIFILSAQAIHVVVLPFLDLTLMGANSSVAILTSMVLSVKCLGEKFVPKHDVTAFFLISVGSICIILNAHTEKVSYSAEQTFDILISPRALSYYAFATVFYLAVTCYIKRYLQALRSFEFDAENYDRTISASH